MSGQWEAKDRGPGHCAANREGKGVHVCVCMLLELTAVQTPVLYSNRLWSAAMPKRLRERATAEEPRVTKSEAPPQQFRPSLSFSAFPSLPLIPDCTVFFSSFVNDKLRLRESDGERATWTKIRRSVVSTLAAFPSPPLFPDRYALLPLVSSALLSAVTSAAEGERR